MSAGAAAIDRSGDERDALFAEHRTYLFAVAYRMLGIAEDAEDIVQEAWIRFARAQVDEIEYPRTYLVTIVTRLCIDALRSARRRREQYVGVWLPEPVPTSEALADGRLEQAELASFAFLLMLERLSPLQRAVLVLYDVLDYSHDEVAATLGSTVAASRQALGRARRRLAGASLPESAPTGRARELVGRFLEAVGRGEVEDVMDTPAPDVVLMSDGGGKVAAARRPLSGGERVARFFAALGAKAGGVAVTPSALNGQPAVLVHEHGVLTNAYLFDVSGDRVTAIYVVRNPHKLRRLGGRGEVGSDGRDE